MGNLLKVLVSPTVVFEKLKEKGGWVAAYFTLILAAVVNVWLLMPVIMEEVRKKLAESALDEKTREMSETIGLISGYAGAVIGAAVMVFITALLLLLVNVLVQGEAKYMQLVKVAIFSSVPGVVGSFLTGVMVRLLKPDQVTDVTLSLGAFVSEKKGFVFGLANAIGPFGLWGLALMIIGTAVMTGRSRSKVGIWVVLGWLILTVIGGLLA